MCRRRIHIARFSLILLLAVIGLSMLARAADEEDYSAELPRIPPVEPADAVKTFKLVEGFHIELMAHEPMVVDPIAAAFDARGRLYVIEMRDYSEQADDNLGRVRLLEDTDHDGQFDKSTVFAEGLSWPTAIACWDDGVFVAAPPDVFYIKDTDGDSRADVKTRIYTGFGRGNVQGLVNSFTWGLDNRIHGATSSAGANVTNVAPRDWPGNQADFKPISLRGRDFAFDPRTLVLEPTSGGAQHGLSFDDWGRKFVCSNSDHLQMVMYDDADIARNPYLAAPGARISIAADGGQAPVYRISPVEPWRIVRTRLRVAKKVPGPVEGGGTPAGYFTGSTGVTIYRGDVWPSPPEGRTVAIIGDVGSNIIHRKALEPNGLEFIGKRIDEKREFVASTDIWFRPVQFLSAPDGCLWVLDMYREVIEHPASLPPVIKRHLDLTSGRDRGRIYRIVPDGAKLRIAPNLQEATTEELVRTLNHANGWHRDTAARLLYERQDKSAIESLRLTREDHKGVFDYNAKGRLHSMYALRGMSSLDERTVLRRLDDSQPQVREEAARLAGGVAGASAPVRARLARMVGDDDAHVRYRLAFTLGDYADAAGESARIDALTALLRRDVSDKWMRVAVLSSIGNDGGALLEKLVGDAKTAPIADDALLAQLAEIVGRKHDQPQITIAARAIGSLGKTDRETAAKLQSALQSGLAKAVAAQRATPPAPITRPGKSNRDDVLKAFQPALRLTGDAPRGKLVFTKLCVACHKAEGVGQELGPNLAAAASRGAETILANFIDPNREVNPQFVQYIATTVDGRTITGMITAESATSVTLTRAKGESDTLLRVDITELRDSGLSLMPEGLEKGLEQQDVADLIAYLLSLK